MGPERIKKLRKSLGLTQVEMAKALSLNEKARVILYWEAGAPGRSPKGPALILLRMLEKHPGRIDEVREIASEIERENAGGAVGEQDHGDPE